MCKVHAEEAEVYNCTAHILPRQTLEPTLHIIILQVCQAGVSQAEMKGRLQTYNKLTDVSL